MTADIFTTLAQELADMSTAYDYELTEHRATQDDRDHAYHRLAEAWELTSTGSAGCADRSLADVMRDDQDRLWTALGHDDTGSVDELVAAVESAVETLPTAADALRDYLVSQGYPADPVTSTDLPPTLRALADVLL